jgi:hypothetical protein
MRTSFAAAARNSGARASFHRLREMKGRRSWRRDEDRKQKATAAAMAFSIVARRTGAVDARIFASQSIASQCGPK